MHCGGVTRSLQVRHSICCSRHHSVAGSSLGALSHPPSITSAGCSVLLVTKLGCLSSCAGMLLRCCCGRSSSSGSKAHSSSSRKGQYEGSLSLQDNGLYFPQSPRGVGMHRESTGAATWGRAGEQTAWGEPQQPAWAQWAAAAAAAASLSKPQPWAAHSLAGGAAGGGATAAVQLHIMDEATLDDFGARGSGRAGSRSGSPMGAAAQLPPLYTRASSPLPQQYQQQQQLDAQLSPRRQDAQSVTATMAQRAVHAGRAASPRSQAMQSQTPSPRSPRSLGGELPYQ